MAGAEHPPAALTNRSTTKSSPAAVAHHVHGRVAVDPDTRFEPRPAENRMEAEDGGDRRRVLIDDEPGAHEGLRLARRRQPLDRHGHDRGIVRPGGRLEAEHGRAVPELAPREELLLDRRPHPLGGAQGCRPSRHQGGRGEIEQGAALHAFLPGGRTAASASS
jgi:hypothetical protein